MTFYEDLGGHLYYIHYVDGKASEIVGFEQEADNSYTAFCLAYDELSDNYWTLENLKDTIQEGDGTIVETRDHRRRRFSSVGKHVCT